MYLAPLVEMVLLAWILTVVISDMGVRSGPSYIKWSPPAHNRIRSGSDLCGFEVHTIRMYVNFAPFGIISLDMKRSVLVPIIFLNPFESLPNSRHILLSHTILSSGR